MPPPTICQSCYDDDCPVAVCCAEEHLICADCINGLVRAQIGTAGLLRRHGGLACIAVDGKHVESLVARNTAHTREMVQPMLEPDVLRQYLECLAPADADSTAEPSSSLAYWTCEMLNVACPACDEILDPRPDGCIAMRCGHCHAAFCWACFADDFDDAHQHAISDHGDYFPPQRVIDSWHTRWRWRRVARLITSGALPSRAPPAKEARDDLEISTLVQNLSDHAFAAALASLNACENVLKDFELWPFPREEPRVRDFTSRPPLILAVQTGIVAAVRSSLEQGDRVDESDGRGMTCLHHAAHRGHADIVEVLVQHALSVFTARDGDADVC